MTDKGQGSDGETFCMALATGRVCQEHAHAPDPTPEDDMASETEETLATDSQDSSPSSEPRCAQRGPAALLWYRAIRSEWDGAIVANHGDGDERKDREDEKSDRAMPETAIPDTPPSLTTKDLFPASQPSFEFSPPSSSLSFSPSSTSGSSSESSSRRCPQTAGLSPPDEGDLGTMHCGDTAAQHKTDESAERIAEDEPHEPCGPTVDMEIVRLAGIKRKQCEDAVDASHKKVRRLEKKLEKAKAEAIEMNTQWARERQIADDVASMFSQDARDREGHPVPFFLSQNLQWPTAMLIRSIYDSTYTGGAVSTELASRLKGSIIKVEPTRLKVSMRSPMIGRCDGPDSTKFFEDGYTLKLDQGDGQWKSRGYPFLTIPMKRIAVYINDTHDFSKGCRIDPRNEGDIYEKSVCIDGIAVWLRSHAVAPRDPDAHSTDGADDRGGDDDDDDREDRGFCHDRDD
jgi:hypothetical protein